MARGRKKRKMGVQGQLLLMAAFFAAIVFLPTTMLLVMGMIPTIVAVVIDRTGKGTKALTVGAMNLAGCTPFLIDLWTKGHTPDAAFSIISNPSTMVVMFSAAGVGYLISWSMSGIVGTLMAQRAASRLRDIEKKKEALVALWGAEVTGDLALDEQGFPLETDEGKPSSPGKRKP